ncbi:hypothetical protein [Ktedonospora formicarum]|uniref:Uncharacterized protein n=1 Tax=Ktedonospora formicarum TaxID=2778364 RepID=A0A8J3MT84_9CHLR|nr:hypothetical protein [Ktedonospora formicarum]GHO47952.1 hypothetical protein KSX_61150 [Ktedonospora formicarum]
MVTANTRIASTLTSRIHAKSLTAITGYSKTDDYRPIPKDISSPNPGADRALLARLRARVR